MSQLRAGAAVVDITPGVGMRMGGYGARRSPSNDIHDPLHVRTLVLDDGQTTVVLAVCDMLGVPRGLVDEARMYIQAETGIPVDRILISATHTHSGPNLEMYRSAWVTETARRIAGSVTIARRQMQPVILKAASSTVTTVGQNRRQPDWPIDTTARVLLADPGGGGEPVATLVNYGCHATVLEWDNLAYSADIAGSACRSIERELGGTGIFLQGCAGNINPVWMRHDFREIDRVGGILGATASRAVHELRPLGEGQWVVNLNWSEDLAVEPAPGTVIANPSLAAVRRFIDLPKRVFDPEAIDREIGELESRLEALADDGRESRRAIRPRLNRLRTERQRGARQGARPGDTQRVEVQAIRLGAGAAILALPGEFFIEIGDEIQQRSGLERLFIAGYANDYISYVPTAGAFENHGYEVGCALFAPESADLFVKTSLDLLAVLFAEATP